MKSKKEIISRLKVNGVLNKKTQDTFEDKLKEELQGEIGVAENEVEKNKDLLSDLQGLSKLLISIS
jgi:hypothetical protein